MGRESAGAAVAEANLTGAVSSVKMSDIDGLPISNAATALQGRMAGVTVSSFTGQPGKNDPQIRIRGIGTFGNNSPLVIIDGVPNEVGALGDISVDDIENVSKVKEMSVVRVGNIYFRFHKGKFYTTKFLVRP